MCDRIPRKFDVQTSVVKSKSPWAIYHTMVSSTEELYCLNMQTSVCSVLVELRLVKKLVVVL